MKPEKKKAVFLDRDGTINEDTAYVSNINQVKLIGGAAEAIRLLKECGFLVIIVTNQSGVARGYLTEEDVGIINEYIKTLLKQEAADIDAFFYCPHHPDFGSAKYRKKCTCRKPEAGMLFSAAEQYDIDLGASFIIGDKMSDITAGVKAGVKGLLISNNMEEEKVSDSIPVYTGANLLDCAKWLADSFAHS